MAFVFQPDPTLPLPNSFCTVAEADDYQSTKLNTTWVGLSNTAWHHRPHPTDGTQWALSQA